MKGQDLRKRLLDMVDEDTRSFNAIMAAFALPKGNDAEKVARKQAVQAATKYAIEVPYKVMELSLESMTVVKAMAEIGNPAKYTSQWPANAGYGAGKRPRSATIVITKKDGGVIGS